MIKAVYPGTFDPLTRGHEELVRRASRLFDSLILGIAASTPKRTYFTLDERIEMAREVLGDVKNVQVRRLQRPADRLRAQAGRARGAARPARGVGLRVRVPARRA